MAQSTLSKRIAQAALALREFMDGSPTMALVLGTGFQKILENFSLLREIGFENIPGFPKTSVPGHAGSVALVQVESTPVIVLCGRIHHYEGHRMEDVTFPVRVLAELGIHHLLLTNAAGGINPKFKPGDFMVVTDHINFMGVNPLVGQCNPNRDRFVDLTEVYDPVLRRSLARAARKKGIGLRQGIYLAVSGPSYETPAEIRMFRHWGADAVGMSTVPEAIAAKHCRMRVAALSCITNTAAGLAQQPLSHEEVLTTGFQASRRAAQLIHQFILEYANKSA